MTFLSSNDILVTEKQTGKVMRILNGEVQKDPLLDVAVANNIERGLLGITSSKSTDGKLYVFYLTLNQETVKMEQILH